MSGAFYGDAAEGDCRGVHDSVEGDLVPAQGGNVCGGNAGAARGGAGATDVIPSLSPVIRPLLRKSGARDYRKSAQNKKERTRPPAMVCDASRESTHGTTSHMSMPSPPTAVQIR